jgi:hypothetical protein
VSRVTRAILIAGLTLVVAAACMAVVLRPVPATSGASCGRAPHPRKYIGVITPGNKVAAGLTTFTHAVGVRPSIVGYFVSFGKPWDSTPACGILRSGALPLIQINPRGVSLAAIGAGRQDGYLARYARQVRAFGSQVVISFGHEMNGSWYSWGYRHTSPPVFVAAWRRIVDVFRQQGADNVTWMWTINVIAPEHGIPAPARWWPGPSYVNWVGIDGYYYKPSWEFASLFGLTIKAVRSLTLDPILISETAASPAAGQAAKVANLFAGISAYGLRGFVWFDGTGHYGDWRLTSPAALAAYRKGAEAYKVPAP